MTTDRVSEECEDISSDFFDDFNKEEFMEGLSVIDSWGDKERQKSSRIDFETVDTVKDLRELIHSRDDSKKNWQSNEDSALNLDEYIKPGSRRDPNKTNEAIKRDKEIKVKQYLAKSLEATDDLRPPGTELDDYFDETKATEAKKHKIEEAPIVPRKRSSRERHEYIPREKHERIRERLSRERRNIHYRLGFKPTDKRCPSPHGRSPMRRSPRRGSPRYSPSGRFSYRIKSPLEIRRSPHRHERKSRSRSPRREIRRSPRENRRSPRETRRSPREIRRSPRRQRSRSRNREMVYSRDAKRSHSRDLDSYRSKDRESFRLRDHDSFLYPNDPAAFNPYPPPPSPSVVQYRPPPFVNPLPEYLGAVPNPYFQPDMYNGGFVQPSYDYGAPVPGMGLPMAPDPGMGLQMAPIPQPAPPMFPQPVPAPVTAPVPTPILNPLPPLTNPEPTMLVGEVDPKISPIPDLSKQNLMTPFDALAKLVAEGKLSKEDYLKLAPNRGKSSSMRGETTSMDAKARVDVLNRCHEALSKLTTLRLPNSLVVSANMAEEMPKSLAPKYCSPLKRQVEIEFDFTKFASANVQNNKQVLESIVSTLGLNHLVAKSKRKSPKNMKDAETQTTKPYCDLCEVREATDKYENSTSTDPKYFTSTIHTQVVEQDLMSSKAVFGAAGGVRETGPMSIAHLTPAQLVSQLAARAKSLKGPDNSQPLNQYPRRPPQDNYDNYGRGGGRGGGSGSGQYQNYNNYRY